jgi:AraC-like DNA-binding protein
MNQNLLEASSVEKINPVDQIKQYIVSHFDDPAFSIKSLASHFSMSVSSLSTFFKINAGVQLIDFITDLRINKATELLQNSNLTISEIGMSIGYFNANAFIRRFKQIIGVTPGEYRRQSNIEMQ